MNAFGLFSLSSIPIFSEMLLIKMSLFGDLVLSPSMPFGIRSDSRNLAVVETSSPSLLLLTSSSCGFGLESDDEDSLSLSLPLSSSLFKIALRIFSVFDALVTFSIFVSVDILTSSGSVF